MTAPILDPWASPVASSGTTTPEIVDPWATTQPISATTEPPLSTTSAVAPYRGVLRGLWDDVTKRPLRAAGEAIGGLALGAGRAAGVMEQGLGAAIEGVGGIVQDDDPRTFNPVQRLGRIVRRRGESLTEMADIVEMETTIGKGAKLVGDVGTDVLSTVAVAALRPVRAIGGAAGASPNTVRAVRESLRYAVGAAPSTAARSVAGESSVQAAAELLGNEELAQTLEGSMAKRVLGDLALNTTLGLGLDVGFAKLMQLRAAARKAARATPSAPSGPVTDPARLLPSGAPRPTAGDVPLGPPIPMRGAYDAYPEPANPIRALLGNPDPRPTAGDTPLGPAIPTRGAYDAYAEPANPIRALLGNPDPRATAGPTPLGPGIPMGPVPFVPDPNDVPFPGLPPIASKVGRGGKEVFVGGAPKFKTWATDRVEAYRAQLVERFEKANAAWQGGVNPWTREDYNIGAVRSGVAVTGEAGRGIASMNQTMKALRAVDGELAGRYNAMSPDEIARRPTYAFDNLPPQFDESVQVKGGQDDFDFPVPQVDEEAAAVLRSAKDAGDAARRNAPPSIIMSSMGAGQWKQVLANPVARQTIMRGGVIGVGLSLEQAEDERLSGTGRDLVALGTLSLAYPALRRAALSGAGSVKSQLMQSPTGMKVLNALSYDLTMDPVVKDLVTQYEQVMARGKARAAELATQAASMGPNVDRRISDLIEGEAIEPVLGDLAPEVIGLAQRIANEFAEVGRLKVQAGVMSQETLDAFNRKYLPRMYGKYLGEAAVNEIPLSGGRKIRLEGDIQRMNLPPEIRAELGEIREASTRTKIGLERQYRQAATGMLFDQLSNVPGVILPESATAREAALGAKRAYYEAMNDPAFSKAERQLLWRQAQNAERAFKAAGDAFAKPMGGYTRLPDTPGYGQLRGAVVRQDVADYLNMLPEMESGSPWMSMLSLWKKMKTVFNPGTHVGNFMSNVGMAHMGGLPMTKQATAIPKAIKALREYDPDVRYLAERGDLDRGLPTMGDPAVVNGPEEALQALMETTRVETRTALEAAGVKPANAATKAYRKFDRAAQQAYGAGDGIFRIALFKELTNNGMAREEAADFVRKQFVDYSTRSPALRLISRTVSPFVMFPAKALPRIADQVLMHPERWATLAMVWGGLDQYSRRQVGPMDLSELPEGERRQGYLVPGRVQLPAIGDAGDFYTLDIARWTPFSALTGEAAPGTAVGQFDAGLPALVSPSGPIADIGNLIAGRNSYTGQPVVSPSMGKDEKLKAYGMEILKFVAPTALGVHIPNVVQDVENLDMRAALVNSLGLLGAKPRVVTPGKEAVYAEYELNQRLADARKQYDRDLQRAQNNPAKQERLTLDYESTLLRVQAEYLQRLGAYEDAKQLLQGRNALTSPGVSFTPR